MNLPSSPTQAAIQAAYRAQYARYLGYRFLGYSVAKSYRMSLLDPSRN